MDTRDLDIALNYFYNNRKAYNYFKEFHNHFQSIRNISQIESQLILQKLVKEGYIIEEVQVETQIKPKSILPKSDKTYGYFITFDGIVLVENGNFSVENVRREKEKINAESARILDFEIKQNQKEVNFWSVVLSGVSATFIVVTAVLQCNDTTDKEIRKLKKAIQSGLSETRRIDTTLREINFSIQSQKNDTAIIRVLQPKP